MNESTNQPAIGTRISFYANLRTKIGHIAGYTPDGRAICIAEEGGGQFIQALDAIRIVPATRRRDHYDPAAEGILAGRREAMGWSDPLFTVGDRVAVAALSTPATITGITLRGDYYVSYDGISGDFTVPASHVQRLDAITLSDDDLTDMHGEIEKLREETEDMRRQIADLIHERTTLRHAMQQIRTYRGGRYTDDAQVMREIAEAAVKGENITPRR